MPTARGWTRPPGCWKGVASISTHLNEVGKTGLRRLIVDIVATDGPGHVAAIEFGDPTRPLDVLFLHANGFNANTYCSALAPLAGQMRILALDMRGHGHTQLPTRDGGQPWTIYADDLLAVLSVLGETPAVIAGHSMGGATALLALPRLATEHRPKLVLFDPVLPPREVFQATPPLPAWEFPMVKAALKRRDGFVNAEAAFDTYKGRGAFKTWSDAALRGYLADGLLQAAGGIWQLACTPAWEAANFAHFCVANPYPALDTATSPIRILRADQNTTCHYEVAAGSPGVRLDIIPGTTHFLPIERPDIVATTLRDAVADNPEA